MRKQNLKRRNFSASVLALSSLLVIVGCLPAAATEEIVVPKIKKLPPFHFKLPEAPKVEVPKVEVPKIEGLPKFEGINGEGVKVQLPPPPELPKFSPGGEPAKLPPPPPSIAVEPPKAPVIYEQFPPKPKVIYGKLSGDAPKLNQAPGFDVKNVLGDKVGAPADAPGRFGENKVSKNVPPESINPKKLGLPDQPVKLDPGPPPPKPPMKPGEPRFKPISAPPDPIFTAKDTAGAKLPPAIAMDVGKLPKVTSLNAAGVKPPKVSPGAVTRQGMSLAKKVKIGAGVTAIVATVVGIAAPYAIHAITGPEAAPDTTTSNDGSGDTSAEQTYEPTLTNTDGSQANGADQGLLPPPDPNAGSTQGN